MANEPKLMPCPFCGGKVELDTERTNKGAYTYYYWSIHCAGCNHWFFEGASKQIATERWNRRANGTAK